MSTIDIHELSNNERTFEAQPKSTPEKLPQPIEERLANLHEAMHILENVARMLGHNNSGKFIQDKTDSFEDSTVKRQAEKLAQDEKAASKILTPVQSEDLQSQDPSPVADDAARARQSIDKIFEDAA